MDDDTEEQGSDGEAGSRGVAKFEYWVDKTGGDSLCGPSLLETRVDLPVDWEWANKKYHRFKKRAEAEQCLARVRQAYNKAYIDGDFTVPNDKEHDA